MIIKSMSLSARKELLASVRQKYRDSSWIDKGKILDGFVAATGYDRKHAIQLMNSTAEPEKPKERLASQKYDEQTRQALYSVWYTANQICSKRLVPFLPELIGVMERYDHLRIPAEVRTRLLGISPATVDRLLRPERETIKKGVSTTRPGNLLKHQIQIRTFADWDDVTPGFLEGDLVAHCGGNTNGAFLNTLVLVDIATGWNAYPCYERAPKMSLTDYVSWVTYCHSLCRDWIQIVAVSLLTMSCWITVRIDKLPLQEHAHTEKMIRLILKKRMAQLCAGSSVMTDWKAEKPGRL